MAPVRCVWRTNEPAAGGQTADDIDAAVVRRGPDWLGAKKAAGREVACNATEIPIVGEQGVARDEERVNASELTGAGPLTSQLPEQPALLVKDAKERRTRVSDRDAASRQPETGSAPDK